MVRTIFFLGDAIFNVGVVLLLCSREGRVEAQHITMAGLARVFDVQVASMREIYENRCSSSKSEAEHEFREEKQSPEAWFLRDVVPTVSTATTGSVAAAPRECFLC